MTSKKSIRLDEGWHFEVGRIYLVYWLDHWTYSGWHDPELPNETSDSRCTSVGICTYNGDDIVHLSTTVSTDNLERLPVAQCTSTMGILKNCIQEAWELQGVV